MLDCAILQTDAELTAVADEWRQLHSDYGTSPFSSYEFFDVWWRTTGNPGRTLHIITGRRNGRLLALLPLAVIRKRGFRILQATGAEGFYQCDMLCSQDAHAITLWNAARSSPLYDFAHIRDVCPDSACEHALSQFARLHDRNRAPYLRIEWATREAWEKTLPKRAYQDIVRRTRRLDEKGKITYEVHTCAPVPESWIHELVKHKTLWCENHGKQGMFDQSNILAFFRQWAKEAARRRMLFLASLKCDDAVIGYHLGLRYGKKLYSYTGAVYDAAWARYSPGHIMNIRAIAWAIENSLEEYDQMQGEFAYKYQFSNGVRECKEYMFHHSLWGCLGAQLFIRRRALRKRLSGGGD